ncbi:b(0,+)-type amino acid transporter 1-like [Diadema antillarum]|uniref:b(0,+)-type amino acid transporter 1-like n=1 Tax=Diadema antillarum TaxID=105358 RepID=UPI003A87D3A8
MSGKIHKADQNGNVDGDVKLKREVGLVGGIAFVIGGMIGSGIFVSPVGVLRETESVGMSLVVWLLCGLLVVTGCLCYAELGTMIPKSGGDYAYLLASLGDLPAFLFSWTFVFIIRPATVAILCLVFGTYTAEYTVPGECVEKEGVAKLFAILALLLLTFINSYSVKAANQLNIVFTIAKTLLCFIIIAIGFVNIARGETNLLVPSESFKGSAPDVSSYALAFYQGLWAYEGWTYLNSLTEELKNPRRNLPLAVMIGIPVVTLIYIVVNIAYFTVITPAELMVSKAVAITFAQRTMGIFAWIVPVGVCISTFGAANASLFTAGRLPFVAAREGHMVQILSMVHAKRFTPQPAIIFVSITASVLIFMGNFDSLLNYFSFAVWMFYGLTVTSLLVLRRTHPDSERPIKVPLVLPIIFVISSLYLIVAPIISDPVIEFLYAFLFILSGVIVYIVFVRLKITLPGINAVTCFLQKLLFVIRTSYDKDEKTQI